MAASMLRSTITKQSYNLLKQSNFSRIYYVTPLITNHFYGKQLIFAQTFQSKDYCTKNSKFLSNQNGSKKSKQNSFGDLITLGLGISLGAILYNYLFDKNVEAADIERPKHKISRKVKSDTDNSGLKITLYQYQTCPFCCKVRAFLDYHGFAYDVIEVNSVMRKQIKWSKSKKVPILVFDDVGPGYLEANDSSVIISILKTYMTDPKISLQRIMEAYPGFEAKNDRGKKIMEYPNKYFIMGFDAELTRTKEEEKAYKEERKWRDWVDNDLVHTLSPNIYRTPSEALQAFNYFSDAGEWERHFSTFERKFVIYVGALAMYFVGKILKRRHQLKDDVRESMYDSCKKWTKALGDKKFMGGDKPNLADLATYGVLNAIQGCIAFQDLLSSTKIGPWFERMSEAVKTRAGADCW